MSYFLAKHPCGKHLAHGPVWMGHVREGEFSRILCTQAVFWAGFGGRICHHHRLQHPGTAQLAPEDLCLQVRLVKVHLGAHVIKAQERFSVDEKIRLEGRPVVHTESQFSNSGHAGLSAHVFVVMAKANFPRLYWAEDLMSCWCSSCWTSAHTCADAQQWVQLLPSKVHRSQLNLLRCCLFFLGLVTRGSSRSDVCEILLCSWMQNKIHDAQAGYEWLCFGQCCPPCLDHPALRDAGETVVRRNPGCWDGVHTADMTLAKHAGVCFWLAGLTSVHLCLLPARTLCPQSRSPFATLEMPINGAPYWRPSLMLRWRKRFETKIETRGENDEAFLVFAFIERAYLWG